MILRKGYSLVELVIAIGIISVAFYALISLFATLAPRDIDARSLSVGTHIMNRKIEEVMLKSFPGVTSEAASNLAPPFSGYNTQVVVTYAATADINSVSAVPTKYKKIRVLVWGPKLPAIEGVTLAVTYEVKK
jgi:prepilin-type N-terminal cleavage/methylation domain-containing protein